MQVTLPAGATSITATTEARRGAAYNGTGRLVAKSSSSAGTVLVDVPAGGFSIVRR